MSLSSLSTGGPAAATHMCEELASYSHGDRVWAVAVSPDGRVLASACQDGMVRVVPAQGGGAGPAAGALESGHSDAVYDVSLGGRSVATAGRDGAVFVRKVSRPAQPTLAAALADGELWARSARLSPDGRRLLSNVCGNVFVTDVHTGRNLHELTVDHFVVRLAAGATHSRVFLLLKDDATSARNFLRVWEPARGAVIRFVWLDVAPGDYYPGIASDAAGDVLAIADAASLRLWAFGEKKFAKMPGYSPPQEHCDCAITADGARVVAAQGTVGFAVWDCAKKVQLYAGSGPSASAVAIADDGITIAAGYDDFSVRTWALKPAAEASRRRRNGLEGSARKRFQNALASGVQSVSFGQAFVLLNAFLKSVVKVSPLSEDEMMEMFETVAEEDAVQVSEDVFVKMFQRIYDGETDYTMHEHHSRMFRECARPYSVLHVKMAARLMCKIRNDLRGQRKASVQHLKLENIEKSLQAFACENGKIDENAFTSALKILIYDA